MANRQIFLVTDGNKIFHIDRNEGDNEYLAYRGNGGYDLWNLWDFVVLFFSKENGDKPNMTEMDRMSAIKEVIDEEIIRREATMDKARILHLKHIGRDSWDRPVYRDNEGILWKDVDPRAVRRANLCTSVDNEFDGELDTGMEYFEKYRDVLVVFVPVPERDVW